MLSFGSFATCLTFISWPDAAVCSEARAVEFLYVGSFIKFLVLFL